MDQIVEALTTYGKIASMKRLEAANHNEAIGHPFPKFIDRNSLDS